MERQRIISTKVRDMKIACSFPDALIPAWYTALFNEVVVAYHACALKPSVIDIKNLTQPIADLVLRYFEVNKLSPKVLGRPSETKVTSKNKLTQNPNKIAVFFSGGKDSVHLVLKLLEKHRREDILCIYVSNINKSESYYEAIATEKICEQLGVQYEIIRPTNSVRLNRSNHNIALRGQLLMTLALPYLIRNKVTTCYFGTVFTFKKIDPPMYCEHEEAFEFLNKWLKNVGLKFDFKCHIDDSRTIFFEMVTRWPEILRMTSSCYTQMNFREHRHEIFKAKWPNIPVYEGCGSCIKCLRINSAILLWDPKAKAAPEIERRGLFKHFELWSERYPSDTSFQQHFAELTGQYTQM